ncbi:MAG: hypothetical protein ICV74_09345, partial [Thermoleophilia bacterium]|nr:hypothetical protein [Thermoleophilia bacterium]
MGLSLLAGPANAGKVALLLDRYLEAIDRDPFLVVPNGAEVERIERDLLGRRGGLLGGSIGTFDDLFARVARGRGGPAHQLVGASERQVVLARAVTSARVDGLGGSLRSGGLVQELDAAIREAEGALLEPHEVGGRLAPLYAAYRGELERLGVWDRELERRFAAELVASDLAAWDGRPVFAYGFEDLTGAQWTLVEALAARSDVLVSLPYEPGRAAFASLARTAEDLARLADGCVEELPAQPWYDSPALAHLERTLFRHGGDPDPEGVPPLH